VKVFFPEQCVKPIWKQCVRRSIVSTEESYHRSLGLGFQLLAICQVWIISVGVVLGNDFAKNKMRDRDHHGVVQ
jgi:hypothetical protein